MITDGHAMELHLAMLAAADPNQREIRRAAADIADQNLLSRRDELSPVVLVLLKPVIKGRLRLFDENDARQSGLRRGLHRQFPGDFVEGSRQCQYDVLPLKRLTEFLIPCRANMRQIPA